MGALRKRTLQQLPRRENPPLKPETMVALPSRYLCVPIPPLTRFPISLGQPRIRFLFTAAGSLASLLPADGHLDLDLQLLVGGFGWTAVCSYQTNRPATVSISTSNGLAFIYWLIQKPNNIST